MNRSPASVRQTLRENPVFLGVPDEVLDEIVTLVSDSTAKISQSLRSVQLFEGLSDEDLLRIQQLGEAVTLAPGQILFEEGEKGDSFFVVLHGKVELVKRAGEGEQKLAVTRDGDAFGEMALLNQSPRSATARAVEEAKLLEISREAFDSLLGEDTFSVRMLRGISKALWATSVRLTAMQTRGSDGQGMVRSLSQVMQKSILPKAVPWLSGFSLMARTGSHEKAAGESAWDWFQLGDGRFAVATLRASSEGLPAGYSLVLARTLLRELGKSQSDPAKLLARVNEALMDTKIPGANQQVECALVAVEDGELTWSAAGPVKAAVVRGGGTVVDLPADAPALGTARGLSFRSVSVPVMPGDTFLSLARAAAEALAQGKALLREMASADARAVVARLGEALAAADPVTGEVYENTLVVLRSVEQPSPGAEAPRSGGAAPGETADFGPPGGGSAFGA